MERRCYFNCRSQLLCHGFGHQTANHIACDDSSDTPPSRLLSAVSLQTLMMSTMVLGT